MIVLQDKFDQIQYHKFYRSEEIEILYIYQLKFSSFYSLGSINEVTYSMNIV